MRVIKTQRNKRGYYINPIVETKARVVVLQFIKEKFRDYDSFLQFTLKEYLDEKLTYSHRDDPKEIAKEKERIRRLVRVGWLKKLNKEGKFNVTKKFEQYSQKWRDFDNPRGPLMKSKEKEKIVEKEIRRESKESEKEDVIGFV